MNEPQQVLRNNNEVSIIFAAIEFSENFSEKKKVSRCNLFYE